MERESERERGEVGRKKWLIARSRDNSFINSSEVLLFPPAWASQVPGRAKAGSGFHGRWKWNSLHRCPSLIPGVPASFPCLSYHRRVKGIPYFQASGNSARSISQEAGGGACQETGSSTWLSLSLPSPLASLVKCYQKKKKCVRLENMSACRSCPVGLYPTERGHTYSAWLSQYLIK